MKIVLLPGALAAALLLPAAAYAQEAPPARDHSRHQAEAQNHSQHPQGQGAGRHRAPDPSGAPHQGMMQGCHCCCCEAMRKKMPGHESAEGAEGR